ncbi:hypothetical protein, partial [Myroides marinus]|uniref:hypothetical protein n=1 Tax=Myroides marinus TaxID=703342 RepID=UPI003D9C650F
TVHFHTGIHCSLSHRNRLFTFSGIFIEQETVVKKLNKQVIELQKALEKANLKIETLETLIEVSEQDLKIKIRKKSGAKQSKL